MHCISVGGSGQDPVSCVSGCRLVLPAPCLSRGQIAAGAECARAAQRCRGLWQRPAALRTGQDWDLREMLTQALILTIPSSTN